MLMKTNAVDFHAVEEHQRAIDARLQNWSRWCRGGAYPAVSPMFRMVPPPPRVRGDIQSYGREQVDPKDAALIAKGVAALPLKNRLAVQWCYVKPVSPRRICQEIGSSMEGLMQYLRDGRQMMINRKV